MTPLNALLIFVPITIGLKFAAPHTPPFQIALFLCACLAVLPLAGLMGHATEELAKRLGPSKGALLNATFGNAAELIITILAMRAAYAHPDPAAQRTLLDVVQASITGSILGNVLLVLGLALLVGGWNRETQTFNRTLAGMHASLLILAVAGLMVPALFLHARPDLAHVHGETTIPAVQKLSTGVAVILMAVYLLGLYFSLKTHRSVFTGGEESETPHWSLKKALTVLSVATGFVMLMSEYMVHSIEPMTHALGLSPLFVGFIVIPVIGNAAEHATAIVMARQNKMDIAIGIAIGSSTQIALFVAPLLVFISMLFHHHLSLIFTQVELVALVASVAIVGFVSQDGETHWLEGVQLLAVYLIIALAFLLVPPAGAPTAAGAGH
ncbi:MAG: calcium/proton exchanger [Armatimonadetes bacterium]|nr:calcium/proton exchanger [Armatimonadota bacterium]